jgi:hypothetical protein
MAFTAACLAGLGMSLLAAGRRGLAHAIADRSGHRQRLCWGAQTQLDRGFAHQFYRQFFNAAKESDP